MDPMQVVHGPHFGKQGEIRREEREFNMDLLK